MSTSENPAGVGLVLTVDEGQAFWFLDTLTINKVGDQETRGAFSILDHRCPAGFTPPPHIHRGTDEAFYVLEGQFEGFCGERSWQAGRAHWCSCPAACRTAFAFPTQGRAGRC